MYKIHQPWLHDSLMDSLEGHFMTCLDTPSDHMIKLASNNVITEEMLKQAKPDKNHALIHLIAAGDEEQYGYNRNLDGYPKQAHIDRHQTFVTHAKVYQEHDNKDPNKAIGSVKIAAYNPAQARVELAIWLSKDKAPEEFEMAKQGKQLSFSMGCTVPEDVCNCCGNRAPSPKSYCECMKKYAGQWHPEYQKFAYVSNPHPTYKDISEVKRPADRIAHYLGYYFSEDNEKVASSGTPLLGVELAAVYGLIDGNEGTSVPFFSIDKQAAFRKLLQAEESIVNGELTGESRELVKKASMDDPDVVLNDSHIKAMRSARPGTVMRKLADAGTSMDLKTFAAYATGRPLADIENDAGYKQACGCMPRLFKSACAMAPDMKLEGMFEPSKSMVAECDACNTDSLDEALKVLASKHSVEPEKLRSRVMKVTVTKSASDNDLMVKSASNGITSPEWKAIVKAYTHYKVAFCNEVMNNGCLNIHNANMFYPLAIADHFRA